MVLNKVDLLRDMHVDVEAFVSQMKVLSSVEPRLPEVAEPCAKLHDVALRQDVLVRDLGVDANDEAARAL